MALDSTWTSAELGHKVCDALVAKGKLKAKPAFIREDREAKIVGIFENINLDGQKMNSFTNIGPLEMLVRKGTDGETWVQDVLAALTAMLPQEVATATKQMGMDDATKAELEAAHQKTVQKIERAEQQQQQQQQEDGVANKENGKGNGKNGNRDRGYDREDRNGWDNGGYKEDRGKGGGYRDRGGERGGWNDNAGPREESGGKGYGGKGKGEEGGFKGGGKGRHKDRSEMKCNNCGNFGHKSRDCPEPVNEEAVRQRLAAKAAREAKTNEE
mmetsp:Transcript_44790/g.69847  ORF Transcript_44790/g.69847 Transcript_44790/m.69847 type:complete len:271 (+) Transcript_44790:64-876(+)